MKINLDEDVKSFLANKRHDVLTVMADRECVDANCSEFVYPVIRFKQPPGKNVDQFDQIGLDGLTVFFDKRLETVPEVTLKLEHHFLRDQIRIDGLPYRPEITHHKF